LERDVLAWRHGVDGGREGPDHPGGVLMGDCFGSCGPSQ
jgi:hypothetical protein